MKRFYLVLLSMPLAAQPAWDDQLDHEAIEHRLATEKIVKVMNLRSYLGKQGIHASPTHDVRMVELESGLKGVFKKGAYHHGEVAAYRASKALGLRLVPPTVYRKVKGTRGSLQFYIEAPKVGKVSNLKQLSKKVGLRAVSDMKLFYYVFGQWDTHSGNQLIASYGDEHYIALIDNSVILHRTYDTFGGSTFTSKGRNYDLPSDTGTEFPYDKVEVIPGHKVKSVFKPYVGSAERTRLSRRGKVAYVIWNHRLWLKLSSRKKLRFTKTFYRSTLDAYKSLDEEALSYAWEGWAEERPEHAEDLVYLALMKRDEILEFAQNRGKVYNR